MHYFTSITLVALATIAGSQTIDPNSVPLTTRQLWCTNQISACPLLCTQQTASASGTTLSNTCDPTTLAYTCVCVDNTTPNLANYSQTVPFYECQEFGNQCVTNCGGNAACQSNCRDQYLCGAQNPTRINVTSTSSSTTASSTGAAGTGDSGTFGGLGSGSGSSSEATTSSSASTASATANTSGNTTKSSAANAVVDMGKSFGMALLAGSIFAGFAILL